MSHGSQGGPIDFESRKKDLINLHRERAEYEMRFNRSTVSFLADLEADRADYIDCITAFDWLSLDGLIERMTAGFVVLPGPI